MKHLRRPSVSFFTSWLRRLVLSFVALSLLVCLGLFGYEKTVWRIEPGFPLMRSDCNHCHTYKRAMRYAKSPEDWRSLVKDMLLSYDADTSADERDTISDLLIRRRSADGKTLYALRCRRCHSHSWLEPYMDMEERALVSLVNQHIRQYGYAIQLWEGRMIIEEVRNLRHERQGAGDVIETDETPLLYQEFCGLCHTVTFLYHTTCGMSRDSESWKELILRMQEKAPLALAQEEIPRLVEFGMATCRNERKRP